MTTVGRTVALVGGDVVMPSGVHPRDLLLRDGLIDSVLEPGSRFSADTTFDCTGLLISPGFIDWQVNGAGGVDLTAEPEALSEVARAVATFGVTSFAPTAISSDAATYSRILDITDEPTASGARSIGWHFEGPFLDVRRRGAHAPEGIRPVDLHEVQSWIQAGGLRIVTMAPELPFARDACRVLTAEGISVSIGHTSASADDVRSAQNSGARLCTHLFNAMPPLTAREPGVIACVLGGSLVAGVIVDGVHVAPETIQAAWKALGPDRFCLVTDCTAALGMPDGIHDLGGDLIVLDSGAVRRQDGTLAGSALSMDQAVRNLVAWTGCGVHEAIGAATWIPADALGIGDAGQIKPGLRADLAVLSSDIHVVAVLVGGELISGRLP